jgi:serine/threonine-protein kinase RsbW
MTEAIETSDEVELSFPASARYLRVARLTASSLAADLGFDVDAIDDVRVAVDELCALLLDDDDTGPAPRDESGRPIKVSFGLAGGAISARASREMATDAPPTLDPIARELLAVVTDEHAVIHEGFVRSVRFVRRNSG